MRQLLAIALIVAALAGGGLWWWARASLPLLDGELPVSGLHAPVEVLYDGHGVPHVYAAGAEDAWRRGSGGRKRYALAAATRQGPRASSRAWGVRKRRQARVSRVRRR